MSISNYLENKILDKVFRGTAFTSHPVYASLHNATPGETGASEITGGSYVRTAVGTALFDAAASGAITTNTAVEFLGLPAETITHLGFWDASSGGNFLWGGALTSPVTVAAGEALEFPIGDIDVTLD